MRHIGEAVGTAASPFVSSTGRKSTTVEIPVNRFRPDFVDRIFHRGARFV
jgi:hypothetical protein